MTFFLEIDLATRGNDLFLLEIDLATIANTFWKIDHATIGPRHDCQRAMWPPEAHEFNIPSLQNGARKSREIRCFWLEDLRHFH